MGALIEGAQEEKVRNNYTFVIHPETIGAIAYIATNEEKILNLDGGFVLSTVAGPGKFGIKKTFLGNSFLIKRLNYRLRNLILSLCFILLILMRGVMRGNTLPLISKYP